MLTRLRCNNADLKKSIYDKLKRAYVNVVREMRQTCTILSNVHYIMNSPIEITKKIPCKIRLLQSSQNCMNVSNLLHFITTVTNSLSVSKYEQNVAGWSPNGFKPTTYPFVNSTMNNIKK